LGRHKKPARVRLPQGASNAAAAAPLAGVAAAFVLSPTASAAAAVIPAAAHHVTVPDGTYQADTKPAAHLLSAAGHAGKKQKPGASLPAAYTVRPGDSLSAIAGRFYHNPDAWPVLYWGNHAKVRWADIITTGQVLRIPAEPSKIPSAPSALAPAPPAPVTTAYTPRHAAPAASSQTAAVSAAPATTAQPAAPAASWSGTYPGGAFGACVVARESGGNPQVMNATGHYGLYQFSASTWAAYGGNPGDFGHASVAEQNQVFATALAQGGQSNWSPYDGC
jgi:LysM repeat protein